MDHLPALTSYWKHGACLLWDPPLLWITVVGHAVVALSYLAIPAGLWWLVRHRPDLPFPRMFVAFMAFIILCSLTHVMALVNVWWPVYWLTAMVVLTTGLVSALTAVLLARAAPAVLVLPNAAELAELRQRIQAEQQRLDIYRHEVVAITRDLLGDIDGKIARLQQLVQ